MPFRTHVLSNGLQIVGETIPTARSAAVGFFVETGARDEREGESGLSHFLEHMLFKGTSRRTALDVNLDFDRIGANYNAYTSEEMTVYYASVLPEYLSSAVDILADILRPSLRSEDFVTEKQVILEEIKMYEDTPGSMAWDHAKKLHFGQHPLGNTILGTTESVTALTPEGMRAYFDRRYTAKTITVVAAGQLDWDALIAQLEKLCGQWPGTEAPRVGLEEAIPVGGVHAVTQASAQQQHVLVLSAGPPAESMLRYTATVIAAAIGDDTGSRLYWSLIDTGLVESASCSTDVNHGSGTTATVYSCDPEEVLSNLEIVKGILSEVQQKGITDEELFAAKNKIASRIVRSAEKPMGRLRAIAGAWLYCQEQGDVDLELARFDAITHANIRDCLDRYPLHRPTIVGYGPMKSLK